MCLLIGEKAIASGVLFRAVREYCCSLFAVRRLKISFRVKQIRVSDLCLTGCGSGTSLLFLYTPRMWFFLHGLWWVFTTLLGSKQTPSKGAVTIMIFPHSGPSLCRLTINYNLWVWHYLQSSRVPMPGPGINTRTRDQGQCCCLSWSAWGPFVHDFLTTLIREHGAYNLCLFFNSQVWTEVFISRLCGEQHLKWSRNSAGDTENRNSNVLPPFFSNGFISSTCREKGAAKDL